MRRVAPVLLLSAPAMAACLVLSACTGPSAQTPSPPSSSPAPASPPRAPSLTTALAVTSPHPARSIAGSDGSTHLEYNLVITNGFTTDATLTELIVQDESGRELHKLQGDALRAATYKLLSANTTVTVPASAVVEVVVDVTLPAQSGAVPSAVGNQISYSLPDDAPFRTIIGATTVNGPRVQVDTSTPTVIKPPLRGPGWLAFNGCCLSSAPHRNVLLPADDGTFRAFEMFAIDWVKVSDGAVFRGDGSQLSDHYAYGSEIHAATAGEVVDVRTDLPEAPVNESISGNATVKEPRDYPGNHVTVRLAPDRYAMYAHLQTGSARVKVGDQVKEGDVLGLLGSSGNASAPHLHFSIQDGPDALTSLSLPFVIDGYQLTGTANINPVSLTIDPVMSPQANTYPLTYSIIDLGA